jgi:hypothetical protein
MEVRWHRRERSRTAGEGEVEVEELESDLRIALAASGAEICHFEFVDDDDDGDDVTSVIRSWDEDVDFDQKRSEFGREKDSRQGLNPGSTWREDHCCLSASKGNRRP